MRECRFTVLVDWDEDANCWVGHVPALNWMSDFGATRQELLDRMVEAITGYLDALDKEGLPIPTSDGAGLLPPPWQPRPAESTRRIHTESCDLSVSFAGVAR